VVVAEVYTTQQTHRQLSDTVYNAHTGHSSDPIKFPNFSTQLEEYEDPKALLIQIPTQIHHF